MDRSQSDAFWDSIRDETEAERFVESNYSRNDDDTNDTNNNNAALVEFQALPKSVQVTKLVQLYALRPVLDDYLPETKRLAWLVRHGRKFLEDLSFHHFVPDPEGPLTQERIEQIMGGPFPAKDDRKSKKQQQQQRQPRYRIDVEPMLPSNRQKAILDGWRVHKAGRSRYEEHMFAAGKLGLRYSDPPPPEDE